MEIDRNPSGEELNRSGEVTNARQAASVLVFRDGGDGLEVLLVQRNPKARFMGGAWVFPGGGVGKEDAGHEAAALRELEEEAGIRLDGSTELVPFAHWITPAEVVVRYDTLFYAVEAPEGTEATVDGEECVAARWMRPADALSEHERGELELVFPTIKTLEGLVEHRSTSEALEAARNREIVPVQPRIVVGDGSAQVLMPGEPGYDD
jgi:8-oxo-dGTP pyrophosphatase MutT (NUDIX family)